MSQDDIFQFGFSLLDKIFISDIIIGWVDEISFAIRLNIVSEYSKHFGFKLGNIDSLLGMA